MSIFNASTAECSCPNIWKHVLLSFFCIQFSLGKRRLTSWSSGCFSLSCVCVTFSEGGPRWLDGPSKSTHGRKNTKPWCEAFSASPESQTDSFFYLLFIGQEDIKQSFIGCWRPNFVGFSFCWSHVLLSCAAALPPRPPPPLTASSCALSWCPQRHSHTNQMVPSEVQPPRLSSTKKPVYMSWCDSRTWATTFLSPPPQSLFHVRPLALACVTLKRSRKSQTLTAWVSFSEQNYYIFTLLECSTAQTYSVF